MAGPQFLKRRLRPQAIGISPRAAVGKSAARKPGVQRRHRPRDHRQPRHPMVGIGQGLDQAERVGMQRAREQQVRRRPLHDAAGIHHDDVVRDLGHHRQVVADELDRHADAHLQFQHEIEDLRLDGHVERGGGLVGNQQLRLAGEGHRDHRALAHPARELVRIGPRPVARRVDADRLQQADRLLLRRAPGDAAMQHEHFGDLPADRHDRVQRRHRLLEHHRHLPAAQPPPCRLRLADQLAPVEADRARDLAGPGHEPHHRERRHRFAAAAFPDHAERPARRDRVADARYDLPLPALRPARPSAWPREGDVQAGYLQQRTIGRLPGQPGRQFSDQSGL